MPAFLTKGAGVPFCAPLAVGVAYPARCGLIGGDFARRLPGVVWVPEVGVETVLPPLTVLLAVDRGVVVSPTTDLVGVASLVGEGLRVPDEVGARKRGRFGEGGRLFVVLFAASFGVRGDAVLRLEATVGLTALLLLPTLLRAEDMVSFNFEKIELSQIMVLPWMEVVLSGCYDRQICRPGVFCLGF